MSAREMARDAVETLAQSKRKFLNFLETRMGNRADAEDVLRAAFL